MRVSVGYYLYVDVSGPVLIIWAFLGLYASSTVHGILLICGRFWDCMRVIWNINYLCAFLGLYASSTWDISFMWAFLGVYVSPMEY